MPASINYHPEAHMHFCAQVCLMKRSYFSDLDSTRFFSGQIHPKSLMCWVFETKLQSFSFSTVTPFQSSKQLLRAGFEEFIPHLLPPSSEKLVDHDETSSSHNLTVLFGEGICCHQLQQESSRGSKITIHSD